MEVPLQITFRNLPHSQAIEERIRNETSALTQAHDDIVRCRVVIEVPHRHLQQGRLYGVRIELTVPGRRLVIGREPTQHHAHEDVYVAIRDAFDAAKRQLQSHARRRRHETKHHEPAGDGCVARLDRAAGYGFIETATGREVYFHRNSVIAGTFDGLEAGTPVRFAEELGVEGPQATTVRPAGRRRFGGWRIEAAA